MVAPSLTIIMPAHNEETLLESSVRQVVDGLSRMESASDVLIVENGSTDATADIADRLARSCPSIQVATVTRADYGEAICQGLLRAQGDLVALFDVDYYDFEFLARAVALMRGADGNGADIVVGVKRGEGADDTRPALRRWCTAVFAEMLRLGFGLGVVDTHGMKLMRRSAVAPLVGECVSRKDLFDTELIIRAQQCGLSIAEIPVTVRELRPSRSSIARRALRSVVPLAKLRVALWREEARRRPG
jgi:glycosyltransferase involved in cell wall biosynthesis